MIKNLKSIAATAMAMALCAGFTACSDDDDAATPVTPGSTVAEVFPEGVPSNVGDLAITTDAKGQVTQITDGSEVVKFEYGTFSRATDYQVKMTITDPDYPGEDQIFYIQLNERGYARHALEEYEGEQETDTWDFEYNADGQLSRMKRSEGDNEVTVITYTGGDITRVSVTDDDDPTPSVTEIGYGSTAIDNKGGIMLFDWTFNIDMDEFAVACYAGLLGKPTRHLPVSSTEKYGDYTYSYSYTYTWTLDDKGLPTSMKSQETGTPYTDEITFKW